MRKSWAGLRWSWCSVVDPGTVGPGTFTWSDRVPEWYQMYDPNQKNWFMPDQQKERCRDCINLFINVILFSTSNLICHFLRITFFNIFEGFAEPYSLPSRHLLLGSRTPGKVPYRILIEIRNDLKMRIRSYRISNVKNERTNVLILFWKRNQNVLVSFRNLSCWEQIISIWSRICSPWPNRNDLFR
jgi:hypothetical protein